MISGLSAGLQHNVAIVCSTGKLFAWGDNTFGQTLYPSNLTGVKKIAAGDFHAIALLNNGELTGWGGDSVETFVYGSSMGASHCPTGKFIDISSRGCWAVAIKSGGGITGWGNLTYGQDAWGAVGTSVAGISAGSRHSVAILVDGSITGWGGNEYNENYPTGTDLTNLVSGIYGGAGYSMALLKDGSVTGWGYNGRGVLDIPQGLSNVKKISAGDIHCLALKTDGSIIGWGDNTFGQIDVPSALAGMVVTDIAAGYGYSLAHISGIDSITGWGLNLPIVIGSGGQSDSVSLSGCTGNILEIIPTDTGSGVLGVHDLSVYNNYYSSAGRDEQNVLLAQYVTGASRSFIKTAYGTVLINNNEQPLDIRSPISIFFVHGWKNMRFYTDCRPFTINCTGSFGSSKISPIYSVDENNYASVSWGMYDTGENVRGPSFWVNNYGKFLGYLNLDVWRYSGNSYTLETGSKFSRNGFDKILSPCDFYNSPEISGESGDAINASGVEQQFYFGEAIVFNREINDNEERIISDYLCQKWSIACSDRSISEGTQFYYDANVYSYACPTDDNGRPQSLRTVSSGQTLNLWKDESPWTNSNTFSLLRLNDSNVWAIDTGCNLWSYGADLEPYSTEVLNLPPGLGLERFNKLTGVPVNTGTWDVSIRHSFCASNSFVSPWKIFHINVYDKNSSSSSSSSVPPISSSSSSSSSSILPSSSSSSSSPTSSSSSSQQWWVTDRERTIVSCLDNTQILTGAVGQSIWTAPNQLTVFPNEQNNYFFFFIPSESNLWRTSGLAPTSWKITSGVLPSGLGLKQPPWGSITGTPIQTGLFEIMVRECYCQPNVPICAVYRDSKISINIINDCPIGGCGNSFVADNNRFIFSCNSQNNVFITPDGIIPATSSSSSSLNLSSSSSSSDSAYKTYVSSLANSQTLTTALNSGVWTADSLLTIQPLQSGGNVFFYAMPEDKNLWSTTGLLPNSWEIISGEMPAGLDIDKSGAVWATITGVPTELGTKSALVRQYYCMSLYGSGIYMDSIINVNVVDSCSEANACGSEFVIDNRRLVFECLRTGSYNYGSSSSSIIISGIITSGGGIITSGGDGGGSAGGGAGDWANDQPGGGGGDSTDDGDGDDMGGGGGGGGGGGVPPNNSEPGGFKDLCCEMPPNSNNITIGDIFIFCNSNAKGISIGVTAGVAGITCKNTRYSLRASCFGKTVLLHSAGPAGRVSQQYPTAEGVIDLSPESVKSICTNLPSGRGPAINISVDGWINNELSNCSNSKYRGYRVKIAKGFPEESDTEWGIWKNSSQGCKNKEQLPACDCCNPAVNAKMKVPENIVLKNPCWKYVEKDCGGATRNEYFDICRFNCAEVNDFDKSYLNDVIFNGQESVTLIGGYRVVGDPAMCVRRSAWDKKGLTPNPNQEIWLALGEANYMTAKQVKLSCSDGDKYCFICEPKDMYQCPCEISSSSSSSSSSSTGEETFSFLLSLLELLEPLGSDEGEKYV